MRFSDDRLPPRRHDLVDLPDLVPDVPELSRHAPALALALPVMPIGGGHVGKRPEIAACTEKHGSADQLAAAQVARAVAARAQSDRHVDHRARMRDREQTREARRIIEAMPAVVINPGCDPAEAEAVEPEIGWHVDHPRLTIFTGASLDIRRLRAYVPRPREHFRLRMTT